MPGSFHPATSEQDYTREEFQVLQAVDQYRSENGKRFVSHIELFRLIKSMGYEKSITSITDVSQIPRARVHAKKMIVPRDDY